MNSTQQYTKHKWRMNLCQNNQRLPHAISEWASGSPKEVYPLNVGPTDCISVCFPESPLAGLVCGVVKELTEWKMRRVAPRVHMVPCSSALTIRDITDFTIGTIPYINTPIAVAAKEISRMSIPSLCIIL